MDRQIRFNRNGTTLDLTASPYKPEAGTWSAGGEIVAFALVVEATTLAEVDRCADDVRRWLAQASAWQQLLVGDAVYVETKVCDDLSTQAEFGAGWMRKMIVSGTVDHEDVSVRASGNYTVSLNISLMVDGGAWERSKVASFLEASSASTIVRTDGGLTVPAAATLTARRVTWTAAGFTVRVRWLYSDNDCTFFNAEAGANDVKAYYLAGDNNLYMQDSAGTTASSSALTTAAGAELDLVFKWDPVTPGMTIWVNGTANGTTKACVLEFTLGSELLTNGGFETGGTGTNFNGGTEVDDGTSDVFTGWSNNLVNDGAGNKIEATATAQAGSYAAKITASVLGYPHLSQATTAGSGCYKLLYYTRGDGTYQGTCQITHSLGNAFFGVTGVTGTSYTAKTHYFTVPVGGTSLTVYLICGPGGVVYFDAASLKTNTPPNTYTIFAPSTAAQTLLSWQCWPEALTDAQCAALYAWGRPESELIYYLAPTADLATNAHYKLYNVPGSAPGRLRLLLDSEDTDDQDQIRVGLRPLRVQTTHLWECESGSLGTATLSAVDAAASGGNVAQFTPTTTSTATRVTVTLCADPDDVAAMRGEYRLLLASTDNAAANGINLIKWRLVVAGQAEDYSSEYSCAVVSIRSLLDLGTLSIPPGAWPEESTSATTDVHAGSYITLELAVRNTTGSGGGTLDIDALYLFPAEQEGIWAGDFDVSDVIAVIDHASDPPAAVAVRDERSLEFCRWATWIGDSLELVPVAGAGGSLALYWYRNTSEQAYPNDTSDVLLFYRAKWN